MAVDEVRFSQPMSAPCIYHDDQPSVTLCPGCDFGVCQKCMDEGAEGVCATCNEERNVRRETSAIQREYEVAQSVRRCNYCRVGEDDETPLDQEGYCEACRVLPRCTTHVDLIAVGHCKSCRSEYCRKCLGFTDICQDCQSKQKAQPKKPGGASSAPRAGATSGTSPAGARKKKRPAGTEADRPKKKRPPGAKGAAEDTEEKKKKKKKPTRGEIALKEKQQAKTAGKLRMQVLVVGIVGALVCIVMASGMWMRAQSPEEQAKRLQEQMVMVHQGVFHYYRKMNQMPRTADDIKRALADMKNREGRSIRIHTGEGSPPPGSVIFTPGEDTGFTIKATDHKGEFLKAQGGAPIMIDQYYDSTPR